jgi:transposase-like protein
MIKTRKTFQKFGYYPESLGKTSHKLVIHACDQCGKEREVEYRRALKKNYLCHDCLMSGKNNYFYNKPLIGENNGYYRDGRANKKHYCSYPGCKKQISFSTIYDTSRCKNHAQLGELNGKYIDGRTPLFQLIRGCYSSRSWSEKIRNRDQFKCTKCGISNVVLDAHHLKPFSVILSEFLAFYSQFSPIEDKETLVRLSLSWPEFWEISNGIIVCEECHKEIHSSSTMCGKE